MTVLLGFDEAYLHHDPAPGHPERPQRLGAVLDGVDASGVRDGIVPFSPRPATRAELELVHTAEHVAFIERLVHAGGGAIDVDTAVSPGSFDAALRAAGAGPDAIDRLRGGQATAAFLAVRPPGHHANASRASGFCLFNNIAVAAASLVARGERVLILDWDAHHGNGTQDIFYDEPDVLFVSLHQYPFYPGTGAVEETGAGAGAGTTLNIPLPAGTAGDAYRLAFEQAIVPAAELFSPTWVLVSCGFDAHRSDPLTDLGLSAGDFGDLAARAARLAPPGRRIFFLEGGYDLVALQRSTAATLAALSGETVLPEPRTSGTPGDRPATSRQLASIVERAHLLHERLVRP